MRERTATGRAQPERGSALLLAPCGFMILLLLATVCFDLALAFQRKQELVEVADAAADAAVSYGLDLARLRADGTYCLDAERVAAAVHSAVRSSAIDARVVAVELTSRPGERCPAGSTVTLEMHSPYPFGRAVPGMPDGVVLQATSHSVAVLR